MLSTLFCTLTAVISKIQSYYVQVAGKEQSNHLRWVTSGRFSFALLKKGNLFYVCMVNARAKLRN